MRRDFESEKKYAIKLAIADFIIKFAEGKEILTSAKERLVDDTYLGDLKANVKAKLKLLCDKDDLYDEIVKELENPHSDGWREINRRKVDERRAKAKDIIDKYRQEVNEKVKEILKDVEISVDFTKCKK